MRPLLLLLTCVGSCAAPTPEQLQSPDAGAPNPRDVALEPFVDAAREDADREDHAIVDSAVVDVSPVLDRSTDTAERGPDAEMDAGDAIIVPEPRDAAKDAAGPLCGCTAENAIDQRGIAEVTVSFSCCTYAPKCLRISPGTTVRFSGNFVSHPLGPSRDSDPGGPALEVSSGTEAPFRFPLPGSFGYLCTLHGFDQPLGGMCGAVLVDP